MVKQGIHRAIGWLLIVALLVQLWPPFEGRPTPLFARGAPAANRISDRALTPEASMVRWQQAVADGSVTCTDSDGSTIQQNVFLPLISGGGARSGSLTDPEQIAPLLPPSAASVAPPLDLSTPTDFFEATRFLYTGAAPVQIEVDPDRITPLRVAVLRGRVWNQAGDPLPGVEVAVTGRPEYGCTFSGADGAYDLVVNAGDPLTLRYRLANHLPADRPVAPLARDYLTLDDVVLLPYDSQVTTIDFSEPMQVARGSQINDSSGSRQSTLLFPQNAAPQFVMADGSVRAASATLSVRATEYSVGERGPNAMPAPLPPNSGYTYAVDFTVDEAELAGAVSVEFGEPVINYVENFLNFPVGSAVPTGYYDRQQKRWIPADNGRVVGIIAIQDGLASVDTTGDGAADNGAALGMTSAERGRLAALYTPGQSLWRVPIAHFSPWDHNWPFGPPGDALLPLLLNLLSQLIKGPDSEDCSEQCGSIIEVENQILRKSIPLTGAPSRLHYASDRVPGRTVANQLNIPLSDATLPPSLKRIDLNVMVAGRQFTEQFPAQPNQTYTFEWDGIDAYGRMLQGAQPITVRLGYVYDGVYREPDQTGQAFANFSGLPITGDRTRQEVTLYQEWRGVISGVNFQQANAALAGWNLGIHHLYDPVGRVLYYGDGTRRSANGLVAKGIDTYAGNGESCSPNSCTGDSGPAAEAQLGSPSGIATGPDGSLYLADNTRVRKINPRGIISTVAGGGNPPDGVGDGLPARQARLVGAHDVALGPDGSLYILERTGYRVRRVASDGIITTVAGAGQRGDSGDGGPATEAQLASPFGLAVGADGSIYISEQLNNRIRRVGPNGIITTIAGTGQGCNTPSASCGDGGPASEAQFTTPGRLAIGPDGSLYVATSGWGRLRRIGPDGIISTVARVALGWQGQGLAFGPDSSLYLSWYFGLGGRVLRVNDDGSLSVVAGTGGSGDSGDGGPAAQARFRNTEDIAIGPDGVIYILDQLNHRIRRVAEILPGFSGEVTPIPAPDGSELYIFDAQGRHLRTRHGLTGATIFEFFYDAAGRLTQVKDGDDNTTVIERAADGTPTAIVAPFGQRTTLTVDGNGFLAGVTNPAGETVQLVTNEQGLLTRFTNPRSHSTQYEYDVSGRLLRTIDAANQPQTLARSQAGGQFVVTHSTPLGRSSSHEVTNATEGSRRQRDTLADGAQVERGFGIDGSETTRLPDGTYINLRQGPDPRWLMQAPIAARMTISTPGGLLATVVTTRTAALADPDDLFSLTELNEQTAVNGRTHTSHYTAAERTLTATTPSGRQATTEIDEQGRVLRQAVPELVDAAYVYDERGRLATIRLGSGADERVVRYEYNANGYLAQVTDPLGRTARYSYDAAGRVTQQTLPDGGVIGYAYDANGNLTGITPPGRPEHRFSYTALDLPAAYNPPALSGIADASTQYQYNADRQLTRLTRPDGVNVDYAYDAPGRLTSLTIPRGAFNYSYDGASGQLAAVAAPGGLNLQYNYDGGLVTGVNWGGAVAGSVTYTYDNDFRVSGWRVNNATPVQFQYDADSLLTQAGELGLTHHPQNGLLTGSALGTVSDAWQYNSFGEPTRYTATQNGAAIYRNDFTRDTLGRITARTETIGGVTTTYAYSYDLAGRLVEVRHNGAVAAAYSYDANGNRLSGPGGQTGSYDDQDRLLQYGGATYSYTANGELRTKTAGGQTTTYTYDELGALLNVALPGGDQVDYLIDGQNRRIGKRVNGALVQGLLYQDGLNPVAELDGANNLVALFVYGARPNVPEYMVKDGVTYRILADHLGSPRLVVDAASGAVAQRMDYDEFGNVLQDTSPGFQPFGFAGGLYDAQTGLVRFGARDYDPVVGRWTAKDPIGFEGGDANLYAYVNADPVNRSDPLGYEGQCAADTFRRISGDMIEIFDGKTYKYVYIGRSSADMATEIALWMTANDFFAGAFDATISTLSFNITRGGDWRRAGYDLYGVSDHVRYDSGAYHVGEVSGAIYGDAVRGVAGGAVTKLISSRVAKIPRSAPVPNEPSPIIIPGRTPPTGPVTIYGPYGRPL